MEALPQQSFVMTRKLNLGCGQFHKPGYVNVDHLAVPPPDVKHDLNSLPYPFTDGEFERIEADHLLEHLDDPFGVMKEFHRISKNGAVIHIKVPHFTRGFMHPEHKRGFDVSFPLYFRPSFKGGYQGCDLKLQKMKLNWFAQPYLKKEYLSKPAFYVGYLVGAFVSFFANLSPFFCSRFWCYLVGGFEEIEFEFLVVK